MEEILGSFEGTLLTDGYSAYERFATRREEVVHALCWAHTRRGFVQTQDVEPERAAKALDQIGELYEIERKNGTGWPLPRRRDKGRSSQHFSRVMATDYLRYFS